MKNKAININMIIISLLTIYMLTASLYIAVFNSLFIQIIILISIVLLLIFNIIITRKKVYIDRTAIYLILMMFGLFLSIHNFTELNTKLIADPLIISLCIIIVLLGQFDYGNFKVSFSLIKWIGVFYAGSIYFNYFLLDIYNRTFLSILRPEVANNILESIMAGYYTGFTGQVAYSAGYIVFALAVIIVQIITKDNKHKKLNFFLILFLFVSLLLTQKRAHLFIFIFTTFMIYVHYSKNIMKKLQKLSMLLYINIFIIIPITILMLLTNTGQVLFKRIIQSVDEFQAGGDITSNRSNLWIHAIETFKENPLLGIGWGNFKESIIGTVTIHTEMETHNIYLQLLSETGLIGTTLILIPIIYIYINTLKISFSFERKCEMFKWDKLILFSLFIQSFFLIYGLTGNPLYDYVFLVTYFIAVAIVLSYKQAVKMNYDKDFC